tara:strand:- start:662 stop:2791 length:2130 start_codon:yes stop_codon:yes gene_type:complete
MGPTIHQVVCTEASVSEQHVEEAAFMRQLYTNQRKFASDSVYVTSFAMQAAFCCRNTTAFDVNVVEDIILPLMNELKHVYDSAFATPLWRRVSHSLGAAATARGRQLTSAGGFIPQLTQLVCEETLQFLHNLDNVLCHAACTTDALGESTPESTNRLDKRYKKLALEIAKYCTATEEHSLDELGNMPALSCTHLEQCAMQELTAGVDYETYISKIDCEIETVCDLQLLLQPSHITPDEGFAARLVQVTLEMPPELYDACHLGTNGSVLLGHVTRLCRGIQNLSHLSQSVACDYCNSFGTRTGEASRCSLLTACDVALMEMRAKRQRAADYLQHGHPFMTMGDLPVGVTGRVVVPTAQSDTVHAQRRVARVATQLEAGWTDKPLIMDIVSKPSGAVRQRLPFCATTERLLMVYSAVSTMVACGALRKGFVCSDLVETAADVVGCQSDAIVVYTSMRIAQPAINAGLTLRYLRNALMRLPEDGMCDGVEAQLDGSALLSAVIPAARVALRYYTTAELGAFACISPNGVMFETDTSVKLHRSAITRELRAGLGYPASFLTGQNFSIDCARLVLFPVIALRVAALGPLLPTLVRPCALLEALSVVPQVRTWFAAARTALKTGQVVPALDWSAPASEKGLARQLSPLTTGSTVHTLWTEIARGRQSDLAHEVRPGRNGARCIRINGAALLRVLHKAQRSTLYSDQWSGATPFTS